MIQTSQEPAAQDNYAWQVNPLIHAGAVAVAWLWRWNNDREGQRPMIGRITAHSALVAILVIILVIGNLQWEEIVSASGAAEVTVLGMADHEEQSLAVVQAYYRPAFQARIVRQARMHTSIPERPRLEIITYTVQAGDTAEKIAEKFGLQPTTLMWSNPEMEKAPDLLRVGQQLTILPLDGVYHTIEEEETLEDLAEKYKVTVEEIAECTFNILDEDGELIAGEKLIIPNGTKPYVKREVTAYVGPVPEDVAGSGLFRWPSSGTLTQGYWYGHRAIDIGAAVGTAILASDNGYVSFAGWTDIGYGYLVVLDHANGYQTYYAHLSDFYVVEGQAVEIGQVIGAMGSTGNSTGPHLHYEIRYNGYPTNPLIYLP